MGEAAEGGAGLVLTIGEASGDRGLDDGDRGLDDGDQGLDDGDRGLDDGDVHGLRGGLDWWLRRCLSWGLSGSRHCASKSGG